MSKSVSDKDLEGEFIKYISDVVEYYTPELFKEFDVNKLPSNFQTQLFGIDEVEKYYGYFFADIFKLNFEHYNFKKSDKYDHLISY